MKTKTLNQEFQEIFKEIEKSHEHYFITGNAGTGKSTLLKFIKQNSKKNIAVLAPTGLAALNVNGSTIHKFFHFNVNVKKENIQPTRIPYQKKLLNSLHKIIIDEVSMLRADLLDVIDYCLRINRKKDIPFGGVQMIFIGDLFQLPPVLKANEKQEFYQSYSSEYFFDAHVMKEISLNYKELKTIYRQTCTHFISLLNNIRNSELSDEDFELLNSRYQPHFQHNPNDYFLTLTTTNDLSNQINSTKLKALPFEEFVFYGKITGKFDEQYFPCDPIIYLKKDAQVMFTKNDPEGKFVNGTIGKVYEMDSRNITVQLENGDLIKVEPMIWEQYEMVLDEKTGELKEKVIGTFEQIPLRLAWAITIHKSQGLTFDKVVIDTGRGTFAHGQLYVALSRCKSLEGIYLLKPISQWDIKVDERIQGFLLKLKRV
jgi:energy-coupling factor transporter ATP-binding protein EcfA2